MLEFLFEQHLKHYSVESQPLGQVDGQDQKLRIPQGVAETSLALLAFVPTDFKANDRVLAAYLYWDILFSEII